MLGRVVLKAQRIGRCYDPPMPGDLPHALIVAGPTASGKSALALDLAERLRGTIVNADSMQVYRELRVLTARPSEADEARVPHRLYGVRPAREAGSVAWWRTTALAEMAAIRAAGRLPVLTGGSGLYFASLTNGLADIPLPSEAARAEARALLADLGAAALHARLAKADPETAVRLRPTDGQRVARAWEIWRSTGTGLAAWQNRAVQPAPWRFTAIRLDPPREAMRAAITDRFGRMLEAGAVAEVRDLLALGLDPSLPAMRAHGVPELGAYIRGQMSAEEARQRTILVTGQYVKRQATWFRHHMLAPVCRTHIIHARYEVLEKFSESHARELWSFIEGMG